MATATKVGPARKDFFGGRWRGDDVAHYKLDPAHQGFNDVILSSVSDPLGDETALFPATEAGDIDQEAYFNDYELTALPTLSHAELLESLGYELAES